MRLGDDVFRSRFREEYEKQDLAIGRFNLAIFGKTGVGKSTLLNAIFGEEVAATGIGEPVTKGSRLYLDTHGHLGILDTQGLEVGKNTKELIAELDTVMKQTRSRPLEEQLHVAWYCVRGMDRRFEDSEADFIERLRAVGLPVILVFTQVPMRDGVYHPDAITLADQVLARGLPIVDRRVFLTNAVADPFTGQQPHGLHDLLDATFRVAPEGAHLALAAAQAIDAAAKARLARRAVRTAAASAAAAAAVPIPFSDAALLVPVQLAMMARIGRIFSVPFGRAALMSTLATTAATQGGRAAFTGLLKMVPGAGSVTGGLVGASVATTFTYAMGEAWINVCARASKGEFTDVTGALDNAQVKKAFLDVFSRWVKLDSKQRKELEKELE
ncbi:MAG TPA: GTP-binding protein [Micrococcales bacterium]|uniref:GTPase family protein n=1 Tax=Miniimonas arenae TaxID=676201 RepID=UPI000ECE0280|nr:GTPase [Miniimonas arenae]HCX85226.1 GTP-binding protein [Micrococcales bacterium]